MSPQLHADKAVGTSVSRDYKAQRETDQVRQIGVGHGGKVSCTAFGGNKHLITITLFGMAENDPRLHAMLNAIEFAIRGQFDRGRAYQGMTQYSVRSRFVDVSVRCMK